MLVSPEGVLIRKNFSITELERIINNERINHRK